MYRLRFYQQSMIALVKAKSRWLKQEGNLSQEIQKSAFYKDDLVSASVSLLGWPLLWAGSIVIPVARRLLQFQMSHPDTEMVLKEQPLPKNSYFE